MQCLTSKRAEAKDARVRFAWLPAIATLVLPLWTAPARAAVVPLFNTGVDAGANVLPGGSIDPHWSISAGPAGAGSAFVVLAPSPNYVSSATSRWIWSEADARAALNVPYTFTLSFDLTDYLPDTAVLSGAWAVDNNGSVLLNGAAATGTGTLALAGISNQTFAGFHPFTIEAGFVAGVNTLSFTVVDNGGVGGLNVGQLMLTATALAVPEPSTSALAALGCLLLAALRRRGATELFPS